MGAAGRPYLHSMKPKSDETDGVLLGRFLASQDESAFAALVHRHGGLVWSACRRTLRHDADAEDAFQATFLILARKARAIRRHRALAAWLHGVAVRVAREAALAARRRAVREVRAAVPEAVEAETSTVERRELTEVIDEELEVLAQGDRDLVLRCDLHGQTHVQAAEALGWPVGSVSRRLRRAREVLRGRLTRRGVAPAVVLTGTACPAALAAATVRLVCLVVRGTLTLTPAVARLSAVSIPAARAGLLTSLALTCLAFTVTAAAVVAGVGQEAEQESPQSSTPVRVGANDNHNPEALPAGALARLGTLRFRHDGSRNGRLHAVTRDGRHLITADPSQFRLWEVPSGKLVYEQFDIHRHILSMVVSPDDRWLAVYSRQIQLFDLRTRQWTRSFGGQAYLQCFSPEGNHLLVVEEKEIRWYDVTNGTVTRRWPLPESVRYPKGQFVEGGKQFLALNRSEKLQALWWDVDSGALQETKELPLQRYRTTRVSPDGKHLVVVPENRDPVQVYDLRSGAKVRELQGAMAAARNVFFSADGQTLVTTWNEDRDRQYTVSLWDFATGTLKKRLEIQDAGNLELLPGSRTLAVFNDGMVVLWDTETGQPLHREVSHTRAVTNLQFSADGTRLYSAAGEVLAWDLKTGTPVKRYDGRISQFTLSPSGREIVVVDGNQVRALDTESAQELHRLTAPKDEDPYSKPHFRDLMSAPDGKSYFVRLMKAGYQISGQPLVPAWSESRQVDWRTGHVVWQGERNGEAGGEVLRDGRTLLLSREKEVTNSPRPRAANEKSIGGQFITTTVMTDLRTGRTRAVLPLPDPYSTHRFDVSPRGETLLTGTYRRGECDEQNYVREYYTLHLWDLATGKKRLGLEFPDATTLSFFLGKYRFSADGRRVAAFRQDGVIHLWDAVTGKMLWSHATGQPQIDTAAFSPHGGILATGLRDSTILLWDVSKYLPARFPSIATDAEMATWWQQLAGDDAKQAYQALWRLADAGPPATQYLAARLQPVAGVDQAQLKAWIADLDHKDFARRDAAMRGLTQAGEQAEVLLADALKASGTSPEVRNRLQQLWNQPVNYSPTVLRPLRALEVLEHQGTDEARAVVERLARGDAASAVTRRAADMLSRWRR